MEPPRPGTREYLALRDVVRRIYQRSGKGGASRDHHLRGLALLLSPSSGQAPDEAVQHLEMAARNSKDAHVWSDLAAALLARAGDRDDARDLIRALTAANTAIALAPSLPEARFNQALILEHLFLRNEARAAWTLFRRLEPASPWSNEAMQHWEALGQPAADVVWERKQATLARAVSRGNRQAVKTLISGNRQAAREHGLDDNLGRWGEALIAGRKDKAAEELRIAGALGEALFELKGDQSLQGSVRTIEEALNRGNHDEILRLARGHQNLRQGNALFRRLAFENAAPRLRQAREDLTRSGSPAALWAEAGLTGLDLYAARYEQAARGFQNLTQRADPQRFPALRGRARWGLGMTRIRQGLLADALAHYREAAGYFAAAGETENLGAVEALTAETFRFLGQDDTAWAYRHRALRGLFDYPSSRRLHNLLWEAADAALDVGEPGVALVLQDEGVGVARRSRDPVILAEALIRRSRVRLEASQIEGARQDLEEADRQNRLGLGHQTRGRIALDIAYAQGEILRRTQPALSLPLLGQAIEGYASRGLPLVLAAARVSRARAYLAIQAEVDARKDLEAAASLFERQQAALRDDALRLSYSETAQVLFDELIRLQARHGNPIESLTVSERARAAILRTGPGFNQEALSRLPETVEVIEYALLRDRLLIWIVRHNGVELVDRAVDPATVEKWTRSFVDAVRSGRRAGALATASSPLFDLLIPQQVRNSSSDLLIVPDKLLNEIPFAALEDPGSGRYLVERRAVGIIPSLGSYLGERPRAAKREPENGGALLVADPAFDRGLFPTFQRLTGARSEIESVRPLFPKAEVLIGEDATRSQFLAGLTRHQILHYAGHAVYNQRRPGDSYLLLTPSAGSSGVVFARELDGLDLHRLRLVILSACDTARGSAARSGNLTGLVRPFLRAGTNTILASLWKVDDRTAASLLTAFHRRRLVSGSALHALREAQIEMLASQDPSLSAPANWASFQVIESGT